MFAVLRESAASPLWRGLGDSASARRADPPKAEDTPLWRVVPPGVVSLGDESEGEVRPGGGEAQEDDVGIGPLSTG